MISRLLFSVVVLLLACVAQADASVRFEALDIYLDSEAPVAAWQFELAERSGRMKVVGVENGESATWSDAPYFDREAVSLGEADRIIVADYSLAAAGQLPVAKTRIATIHIQISGDAEAEFDLRLVTAVSADGNRVDADISIGQPNGS